jgi:hypothetical protein
MKFTMTLIAVVAVSAAVLGHLTRGYPAIGTEAFTPLAFLVAWAFWAEERKDRREAEEERYG